MKKILYGILTFIILICMLFVFTGCDKGDTASSNTKKTTNTSKKVTNTSKSNTTNSVKSKESEGIEVSFEENAHKQMAKPKEGEQIAIIHVKNYGDIKLRFFPEVAPKAVENFVTHAKNGYYNGLTFHRVINEFMIQGGDPLGNGTGGESIWGKGFGTELDASVVPYRGALCMAMSSLPNSIGSQFFIEQAHYDENTAKQMSPGGYYADILGQFKNPTDLIEQYKKYGGSMHLFMQYTVFGQAYEGMEVVDNIAKNTKVEDSNGTVLKENQPIIESIEITTYTEK